MKEEDVLKYVPGRYAAPEYGKYTAPEYTVPESGKYTAPELDDLVYRFEPAIKQSTVIRLIDDSDMFIDMRKPEDALKVLKKIKKSCSKMKTCTSGCPFYNVGCCMFKKLGYLLYMNPEHWDIESIEKLLKEYD